MSCQDRKKDKNNPATQKQGYKVYSGKLCGSNVQISTSMHAKVSRVISNQVQRKSKIKIKYP